MTHHGDACFHRSIVKQGNTQTQISTKGPQGKTDLTTMAGLKTVAVWESLFFPNSVNRVFSPESVCTGAVAGSGSTRFRRKFRRFRRRFQETLVQSEARLNRVPEKVLAEVPE